MLKERARVIALGVLCTDLAIVGVAFLAAHGLRRDWLPELGIVTGSIYPLADYLPLLPLAIAVWALFLLSSGTYRSHRTISLPREALDLLRTTVLAGLTFMILLFFLRLDERLLGDDRVSRAWLLLFVVFAFAGLLLEKAGIRLAARVLRLRGYNYRSILVVGSGPIARSIVQSITGHRYWGYRLLGYLGGDDDKPGGGDLQRLGPLADLARIVDEQPVDEVVLTVSYLQHPEIEEGLERAQELGINVRFAFDPFPTRTGGGRLSLSELDGVPLVTWTRVAASPLQFMLKRAVDVSFTIGMLVVLSPLLALVAATVRATGRPILFRQQRVGLNGRLFTLLKFRTMVPGAEHGQARLATRNEMSGPVFKVRADPRVTRVGRWIRRFSLDELPQLWNVLRGDMSLVGPRPPVPAEVAQYDRWQRRRLSMRPGLTCLWQIEGRNELDFDRWMELDLAYIDNWSPWLDIKILMRTIPAVLTGRGAY